MSKLKTLDKSFLLIIILNSLCIFTLSRYSLSFMNNLVSSRLLEEKLSISSLLTKTLEQEIYAGNFKYAWNLLSTNLNKNNLVGFILQDDKGQLLVEDNQSLNEFNEIKNNNNWDTSKIDSHQTISHSPNFDYFIVETQIFNLGSEGNSYKTSFVFYDKSFLTIKKNLQYFIIVLIIIQAFFIIGSFYILRRSFFNAFKTIGNGVEEIIFGKEISHAEKDLIEHYFPVAENIQKFNNEFQEIKKTLEDQAISKTRMIIAQQVSHDIRSPLAALNMISEQFQDAPEKQRIIMRSAISRINDIANQLLDKGKLSKSDSSLINNKSPTHNELISAAELISPLIDSLISEKRIQFRDKQGMMIEANINQGYGLFTNINATEFKRLLSNLINNSCEALFDSRGKVTISLLNENENVVVKIEDNGKGIPQHILGRLGELGVSYGKIGTQSGSGLGVYHAKKTIEQSGGKFLISSMENIGTTIELILPKSPAPKWFVEKIFLKPEMQFISLDDDVSIHHIWKGRLDSLKISEVNIKHLTFTSGTDFKKYIFDEPFNNRLYLIDFELLNQEATGLDLIEELGIGKQSILVTSRYEEDQIRDRCDRLGVKLIPKPMAALVPIKIILPNRKYDAILIDDDKLVRMAWEAKAKNSQKNILTFSSYFDLIKILPELDLENKIYIDVQLANNESGIDISKKLFELGFKNLYLATGFDVDQFSDVTWIKGVIGKSPSLD